MQSGDRVTLRAFEREDLPAVAKMLNDLDSESFVSDRPPVPRSLDELEALYERQSEEESEEFVRFVIDLDGEVVGRCDLFNVDRYAGNCQIGITIAREHWNRGFAQQAIAQLVDYAFRHQNMHKIHLNVLVDNEPAVAAYKKCGFEEEGRLREHSWHDGSHKDLLQMGILRSDWKPDD